MYLNLCGYLPEDHNSHIFNKLRRGWQTLNAFTPLHMSLIV